MEAENLVDEISLYSLKKDLNEYSLETLKKDLNAGFQVALLSVPQAMAYALVAGLPLTCGLFAAIFSCIIAAVLGSTRTLVVGPVNAISILLQFGVADILYNFFRDAPDAERDHRIKYFGPVVLVSRNIADSYCIF